MTHDDDDFCIFCTQVNPYTFSVAMYYFFDSSALLK